MIELINDILIFILMVGIFFLILWAEWALVYWVVKFVVGDTLARIIATIIVLLTVLVG